MERLYNYGVYSPFYLLVTFNLGRTILPNHKKCVEVQITAIDINRSSYEIGFPIIEKAGMKQKINFVEGEALPFLDQLIKDVRKTLTLSS